MEMDEKHDMLAISVLMLISMVCGRDIAPSDFGKVTVKEN